MVRCKKRNIQILSAQSEKHEMV